MSSTPHNHAQREAVLLRRELLPLVSYRFSDELAESDARRLEDLVIANALARRVYAELLIDTAALGSFAETHRVTLGVAPLALTLSENAEQRGSAWLSTRSLGWLAAAVVLAAGCWGVLAMWVFPQRSVDQGIAANAPTQVIGHLTGATDCQWIGLQQPADGYALHAGLLHLAGGIAELTLDSGVQMSLEGPASIELREVGHSYLHQGKLVALVPKNAIGFTLETPTARIVDLGTEFGVDVNKAGTTVVQVLEGKVELRPGRRSAEIENQTPIILSAGGARRIEESSSGVQVVRKIAATPERFARVSSGREPRRIMVGGALASSTYNEAVTLNVNDIINGSGLTRDQHGTELEHTMWHSALSKIKNEFVLFDLGRAYPLESMKVWNYNHSWMDMHRFRGIKQADIYVSVSGKGDPVSQPGQWKLVVDDAQFSMASGKPDYDTPDLIPLGDVEARYVAIVIDSAFGHDPRLEFEGKDVVGLSEVQFFRSQNHRTGRPLKK